MNKKITNVRPRFQMCALLSLFGVFVLGSAASAGNISIPISNYLATVDQDGFATLQVEIGSLTSVAGKKILYASLSIGLASDTCDQPLNELAIQPYGGGATSSTRLSPWREETDSLSLAVTRLSHAANLRGELAKFNVTELVQSSADGKLSIAGFLIRPHWPGCEYRLGALADSPDGRIGELVVKFVDVPRQQRDR